MSGSCAFVADRDDDRQEATRTSFSTSSKSASTQTRDHQGEQHNNMAGSGEYFEQDEPLRVKGKTISVVWNEFNRVLVEEKWKDECVWCHGLFCGDPKYGSSHLHAHLARCASRQANGNLPSSTIILFFNLK